MKTDILPVANVDAYSKPRAVEETIIPRWINSNATILQHMTDSSNEKWLD